MEQYKIISDYSGVEINNEIYTEQDADIVLRDLNIDAKELGLPEVKYIKVLVGEREI